jgi:tRNA A37 threonylcarbamoyladenosine dehydratase
MAKITNAQVTIFGIGGVGSHTLLSLALGGVRNITIIDFDRVSISSLNRHAIATRDHVGKSKVEVF